MIVLILLLFSGVQPCLTCWVGITKWMQSLIFVAFEVALKSKLHWFVNMKPEMASLYHSLIHLYVLWDEAHTLRPISFIPSAAPVCSLPLSLSAALVMNSFVFAFYCLHLLQVRLSGLPPPHPRGCRRCHVYWVMWNFLERPMSSKQTTGRNTLPAFTSGWNKF